MRELKPILDGDVTDSLFLVPADITEQEQQEGLRFTLPLDEDLRTFLLRHFGLTDSDSDSSSQASLSASAVTSARADGQGNQTDSASAEADEPRSADVGKPGSTDVDDPNRPSDGKLSASKPSWTEPRVVLSPREIQNRIRGGESVKELIEYSGMQPRKIESFAYPVLAERARIATLGRQSKPRRQEGPTKLTLWEVLATAFAARGLELADADWDAYRDPTGQWIITLTWSIGHTVNVAEWSYQAEGAHALTIARNELAAELIDPDYARRNRDLAPRSRANVSPAEADMPAAWQSRAQSELAAQSDRSNRANRSGNAEDDSRAGRDDIAGLRAQEEADSEFGQPEDDFDEVDFLQHPDDSQPKRKKKTVMPSWEDVLLGVRPNGPKK